MKDPRRGAPPFDFKPENWMSESACVGHPPEWWFPDDRGIGGEAASETTRAAKAICASCPVATQCLDYALRTETSDSGRFGIFAGLTGHARRELVKKAS